MIRQYLKQKVARSFAGKNIDIDQAKKEIKDEITHILYDQTRRTPIVIPVINEIGGGRPTATATAPEKGVPRNVHAVPAKKLPPKQYPDTETVDPTLRSRSETQAY